MKTPFNERGHVNAIAALLAGILFVIILILLVMGGALDFGGGK